MRTLVNGVCAIICDLYAASELGALMEAMGAPLPPRALQEVIEALDTSHDGVLDWSEFLSWWQGDFYPLLRAFRACDADGSGSIDETEYASLLQSLGVNLSTEQLQQVRDSFIQSLVRMHPYPLCALMP